MNNPRPPSSHEIAAWILAFAAFIFILSFHLLPALISGLLVYELVHAIFPFFGKRLPTHRAKELALGSVALLVIGTTAASIFGLVAFMKSEGGSLPALLAQMADILQSSRASLPTWLADYLPTDSTSLAASFGEWLREHASDLRRIGNETGHALVHILIGMIVGALASLCEACNGQREGPLARALTERLFRLGEAFRRIVFAQVRISAINTALTAIYLAIALPLCGVSLPLTKTMIVVTFLAGLLPVVGNLISNTIIVIVSLAQSTSVAVASLSFLVFVHKLEYFLNARIVGREIDAKAWELLTAMLVLESAFGLPGLVAAPIAYAWLKDELKSRGLI